MSCILNCDSPSYPPTEEEYRQCGCPDCQQWLLKNGLKPSGNEVVSQVAGGQHKETYYFKPGQPLPEHIPDPNARWQRQHEMGISPCLETRTSPEHTWEIMLRCVRCGFLIRVDGTPHDINLVRRFFRAAYEKVRSWLSSDTSAACF